MSARPVIVFGAVPLVPGPRLRARITAPEHPYVVAADGGAATALALGLRPDVVVGDLDSVLPETLAAIRGQGVMVDEFPRDKDATDAQLALDRALSVHPTELLLVGFLDGPRLDHSLANVLMLSRLPPTALLVDEQNECRLLRSGETCAWSAAAGEIVSLLPLAGDAHGVTTSGLRWPLADDTLVFGDTRGVSNEATGGEVQVALEEGLLLVTRHFPRDAAGRFRS